jgi:uncharacterized protein (TIRG00374 family)
MSAGNSTDSRPRPKREFWFAALLSSKSRALLGLAGIVVGLAFVVNLGRTLNFSGVPTTIERVGILGIIALLIPYGVATLIDTETWRRLLTSKKRHLSFSKIFRIRTATEALVITVPLGSILSDPFKAWMLKREFGFPLSTTAASIVYRKTMLGFSQGIVAFGVGLAAVLFPGLFKSGAMGDGLEWTLFIFASAIVILYGVLLGLLCNRAFVDRFHNWLTRLPFRRLSKWFEKREPEFREFNSHLEGFRDLRSVIRFTCAYCLLWITENIETLAILALLGANLTVPQALLMEVTCVLMRASIPMVPGGIGIQDTGYVSMLMASGNSGELAAAFVLLKRFRELLWAALGYILIISARRKDPSLEMPHLIAPASDR